MYFTEPVVAKEPAKPALVDRKRSFKFINRRG